MGRFLKNLILELRKKDILKLEINITHSFVTNSKFSNEFVVQRIKFQ